MYLCLDITADKGSVEVGEGQMWQETVQGNMLIEDRKDHIDTYTATGILSHCTCLITT